MEHPLQNQMKEKVNIEITKKLTGDVKMTDPEARVEPIIEVIQKVNVKNTIFWDLDIQPGEKKTINYVYTVYIRS